MTDYHGHIENLEMLANYGEFSVWTKDNKDRILKAASAIRELQERNMGLLSYAEKLDEHEAKLQGKIEALQEQVKDWKEKAIALDKYMSANNDNAVLAVIHEMRIKAMGVLGA